MTCKSRGALGTGEVLLIAVPLLGALALSGCVTVPPYQRESLTRPGMDLEREQSANAFHAHVHDSRQGATGSTGSTGGGCGCN